MSPKSNLNSTPSGSLGTHINTSSTSLKIKTIEVHPTLPWVACADESGRITVLDYNLNKTLKLFTPDDIQRLTAAVQTTTTTTSDNTGNNKIGTTNSSNDTPPSPTSSLSTAKTFPLTESTITTLTSSGGAIIPTTLSSSTTAGALSISALSISTISPRNNNPNSTSSSSTIPSPSSPHHISPTALNSKSRRLHHPKRLRFFDRHTLCWDSNHYRPSSSVDGINLPPPPTLLVHYDTYILPLNLRSSTSLPPITRHDLQKRRPTSIAAAITPTLLAIGCDDGILRFYETTKRQTIKSVRGHGSGNDIVRVIGAARNPHFVGGGAKKDVDTGGTVVPSRIISICSGGVALLWEFDCIWGGSGGEGGGSGMMRVRLPLARMEGLYSFADSGGSSSGSGGGGVGGGGVGSSSGSNSVLPAASTTAAGMHSGANMIWYDHDRDFLIGLLTGGKTVGVWDLSGVERGESSVPLLAPFLKVKVPSSGLFDGNLTCPLLMHPDYPDTALTFYTVGSKGEVTLGAVPLNAKEMLVKMETHHSYSLTQLKENMPSKIRVYSMAVPRFRSNITVFGTSAGLMVVSLEEPQQTIIGSRHTTLGDSSSLIFLVENSSLFAATLQTPSSPSPLIGPLGVRDPLLAYKSSFQPKPTTHQGHHSAAVRLPPRLILSPSRQFLCLFWSSEKRYEIVHVPTLLDVRSAQSRHMMTGGSLPGPVDTGSDVVGFAWVGKDDLFAIRRPVEGSEEDESYNPNDSKETTGMTSQHQQHKHTRSLTKEFKSVIEKLSTTAGGGSRSDNDASTDAPNQNTQHANNVELRNLIPVKQADDETGGRSSMMDTIGSIAAATATSLGSILLRGGSATAIFGGPVLCIATKQKDATEGMAYFYAPRGTMSEDELSIIKGAHFATTGPSLPPPDLVVWSEDGTLCAIATHSLIAILRAMPDGRVSTIGTTTPLSSPLLTIPSSPPSSPSRSCIESLTFLHDVLYITTRTSIQVTFLNTSSQQQHPLDSFILADINPPIKTQTDNSTTNSLRPPPHLLSLRHPLSTLGYHSGSLLLSTLTGIQTVPLSHPLLRIGILLCSGGQEERASKWIVGGVVESRYHNGQLAGFLERRGYPHLAAGLSGLGLRERVDLCLRYGLTEILEGIIEEYGLERLRSLDGEMTQEQGRHGWQRNGSGGSSSSLWRRSRHTTVEVIGAYMLSRGKAEFVRRMASECLVSGVEGRKEAFFLASLLMAVDRGDAKRLVKRAVGVSGGVGKGGMKGGGGGGGEEAMRDWPVGNFVRDYMF